MKVAISLPDEVFEAAERVSRRLRVSRSRFYSRAIEEYVKKHGRDDVTDRLNAVYRKASSRLDPAMEAMSLEALRREKW